MIKTRIFSLLIVFLVLSGIAAGAIPVRASSQLGDKPDFDPTGLLVSFRPQTGHAAQSRALEMIGGTIEYDYSLVPNLVHVRLSEQGNVQSAVDTLSRSPFVEYAEPDYLVQTQDVTPNDARWEELWGMRTIHASDAWITSTGSSEVVVAVIDTGADYLHPDLINNVWTNPREIAGNGLDDDSNGYVDDIHGWDFFYNDNTPLDEGYHGTHTSGSTCAEGNNGIGVTGVVWHCQLMILRFIGPNGGFTSDAIRALEYAVDHRVKVSNNSWGNNVPSTSLRSAIRAAGRTGHMFITAAGNNGQNIDEFPFYPASYDLDNIISVAALSQDNISATFSNWGTNGVDLHAPGVTVLSTTPHDSYGAASGTSMAAPHVTGAVALLLSLQPQLTYQEIRNYLLQNTTPDPELYGLTVTGGVLDVAAAVSQLPTPPLAPSELDAIVTPDGSVELTWVDNSDDETGYHVWRSFDEQYWTSLAVLPAEASSFSDVGLGGGTFHYRIQAFNEQGYSSFSNEATVTLERLAQTIHVSDLDRDATWPSRNSWKAIVTVTVHDWQNAPISGAVVKGLWSDRNRAGSCMTTDSGQCQITSDSLRQNIPSVDFTVFGAIHDTWSYQPGDNYDPDGDSTGTVIVVGQP